MRVSSPEQSVAAQLEMLNRYADANGYSIAGVFREEGQSAWKPGGSRPELERFWETARTEPRPYDVLIFVRLDRLSRAGILQVFKDVQELDRLGMRWESVQEPVFNNPSKPIREIMLAMMAAFAQMSSDLTSARVKEARSAIAKGLRPGRLGGRPMRMTSEKLTRLEALSRERPNETNRKLAMMLQVPEGTIRYGKYLLRRDGRLPKWVSKEKVSTTIQREIDRLREIKKLAPERAREELRKMGVVKRDD